MAKHIHLPAIFTLDATGTIRTWNAECQWLFGVTPDETVGQCFSNFLQEGQAPGLAEQLAQARTKAVRRDIALVARDGTPFGATLTIAAQRSGNDDVPLLYSAVLEAVAPDAAEDAAATTDAALFKRFSESLPGPFYVLDQVGHLVLWNRLLEQATQMGADELAGAHALDFFDAAQQATIKQKMRNAFELGRSSVEATVIAKDGSRTPYLFNCARTRIDDLVCICGMGIDISERKKAEEILYLHERALHASVNGVAIARRHGQENRIEFVNPAFEEISGYHRDELTGRDLLFMCDPEYDAAEQRKARWALEQCQSIHAILRNRRKNGAWFWSDLKIAPVRPADDDVTHFVGVLSDVTDAKRYEAQLEHLATHDPLTGLANRNLLYDRMEFAVRHGRRDGTLAALVFIDADNFKLINDSLGHAAGDQVLQALASRLRVCVRDSDTVARVGGDEFVVVCANQPSVAHIVEVLERIRRSVAEPIQTDGPDIYVNVSIGVSVYPRDGAGADTLLRAADAAMYHAKFIGRNNYQFYSPELNAAVHKRLKLEASLRSALERGEMFLLFQPKVDIKTGRIVGAEALLRWNNPARGIVSPVEFIPVAEETGFIVPLSDWVLASACATLKNLCADGFDDVVIAVNLSSRQFKQRNFIDCVAGHLRAAGLKPQALELELTESQLMDNPDHATATLMQLKSLGVQLSIDDFGTGYSSLSYLQKFPVDAIKIDRSFVLDVGRDREDAVITKAVISLGHNLNVKVIAEGVETPEQLAFLRDHQCDQIQGFYFSEPVSAQRLRALLETKRTLQYT